MKKEEIKKKEIENLIKENIKYLPLYYILLVILSFLINQFSFLTFKINLVNYADLSELIIYPITDYIFLAFFSIMVYNTLTLKNYKEKEEKKENKLDKLNSFINVAFMILIITVSFLSFFNLKTSFWGLRINFTITTLIFTFLFISLIITKSKFKSYFLVIMVFLYTKKLDSELIKNTNYKRSNLSFVYFKNDTINTDNNLKYIALTNNYLFLLDRKNSKTKIYKRENITNLEFDLN